MNTLVSYVVKQIPKGWDVTMYIDGVEFSNLGPFSDWYDAWQDAQAQQEAVVEQFAPL